MSLKYWEVIRPKQWSYSRKDLEHVLRSALTADALADLFHEDPTMFDFKSLSNEHKVLLLKEDFSTFKDHIVIEDLPKDYIVSLFIARPNNMKPYLNFNELSRKHRGEIATRRPSYIKKFGFPTSKINGDGWIRLLKYDPVEYTPKFVEDIHHFRNKTELRTLLSHHHDVLEQLTAEAMRRSVLTAKEWALFLAYDEIQKVGACYTDEVCEWLEQEISIEILTGAKNSLPLKKALKLVKK